MDIAEVVEKLRRYKQLLRKQIKFDQLVLFGSYAKGTAHADSDMDVAVIVDELKADYFVTRPLLWKIRREIDDRIEPILLEKNSDDSGFIAEIMKHGIII
ncbi:nucleotidyltransferase domain-containing protein [Desulfoprunum benzoelyticum]|uniref:Putative nucleotidyltransferase n=1 Tax=Desulfoprunum benzoelyticum TaxID=1506996 RepID=A0A840UZ30_9BACT|nr:nucleotidyltransferase domain-containing protein [Desulfoprunum benzoelyticum]MBB5346770.1 putative nucleotidyltransferase [Desulfoprunum benzoelyticum]MBM9531537.1 nucleotidyltransferase domain-containing protein [Desulfoprunum benzoelyticum]